MSIWEIIERWGFPAAFSVWLMISVTRELREIRTLLHKQVVLNAVILKTLDVLDGERLKLDGKEPAKEEN